MSSHLGCTGHNKMFRWHTTAADISFLSVLYNKTLTMCGIHVGNLSTLVVTLFGGFPLLYVEAPWIQGQLIVYEQPWRPYLNSNLKFPRGIPERSLASFEWQIRCAIPRHGLLAPIRFGPLDDGRYVVVVVAIRVRSLWSTLRPRCNS